MAEYVSVSLGVMARVSKRRMDDMASLNVIELIIGFSQLKNINRCV
jgi:hypothetical protein